MFSTGESHAELSNLSKDENADQSDFDQLLEVYVAIEDPEGTRLLFETYQSTAGIDASTQRILRAFAPVVLGGLLLFGAIQALLNWRLARRLQRSQDERERLLAQSLAASDHERRTIAADLHDGVVQDLVGITYSLDALAAEDAPHSRELSAASMSTRRSVRSLRSLLVEIYPPNLSQVGLAGAVADLVAAAPTDVDIDTRIDSAIDLSERTQEAVYRAIREALSNIRRHAAGFACPRPAGERRSGNRRPDGHRRRRRLRSSRRGGGARGSAPAGRPRALPGRDAHDHLISGGRNHCPDDGAAMSDDTRADGPIRVLVVDDHEVVRAGLRMLLGREPGIEVVGEASDGAAAQDAVALTAPDVVLMDLSMPGMDGVEATSLLTAEHPSVRVVVLTTFADRDHVTAAIDAGAVGFILKDADPGALADAVRSRRPR